MEKIEPIDENVSIVYDACIMRMREERKNKFLGSREAVINFSQEYEQYAKDNTIHTLTSRNNLEAFNNNEFEKVYTDGLFSVTGRIYYDKIIAGAKDGFCSYCSQQVATTLDHYLPKSSYKLLAVTPSNLVPCCKDCNHNKSDNIPSSEQDVCLNPYFDNIDAINEMCWLKGMLQHECVNVLCITFIVDDLDDTVLKIRLEKFLDRLCLNYLYSVNAAKELNILEKKHLTKIKSLGYDIAKNVILESLDEDIMFIGNKSSWKAATYRALRDDSWYINEYLLRKSQENNNV